MPAQSARAPLLVVEDLRVHFSQPRGLWRRSGRTVRAVDGVSLSLDPGAALGLCGESGSGKTTIARAILRLVPITSGRVSLDGRDLGSLAGAALRRARRDMQPIFQDPYASLDPRMTVAELVGEPLAVHGLALGAALSARVMALLDRVGLPAELGRRYPHELSGGQRQRVGIARAIALGPKLIVADEPVSALDASIRAQIINLLADLAREQGIAILFIAHDLPVVRQLCREVAVMVLGRIVERGPTSLVFARPAHPCTRALLDAVPTADPAREKQRTRLPLAGEPPSPANPPPGCAFHPRCPEALPRCRVEAPVLRDRGDGRAVACHLEP